MPNYFEDLSLLSCTAIKINFNFKYKSKSTGKSDAYYFFSIFTCDVHVLCDAHDRDPALFFHKYRLSLLVPEASPFFRDVHEQYMKSSSS